MEVWLIGSSSPELFLRTLVSMRRVFGDQPVSLSFSLSGSIPENIISDEVRSFPAPFSLKQQLAALLSSPHRAEKILILEPGDILLPSYTGFHDCPENGCILDFCSISPQNHLPVLLTTTRAALRSVLPALPEHSLYTRMALAEDLLEAGARGLVQATIGTDPVAIHLPSSLEIAVFLVNSILETLPEYIAAQS